MQGAQNWQMLRKPYSIKQSRRTTSPLLQVRLLFGLSWKHCLPWSPNQSASIGSRSACDQHQPHATRVVISSPWTQRAAELQCPTGNPDAMTVDAEELWRKWTTASRLAHMLLLLCCRRRSIRLDELVARPIKACFMFLWFLLFVKVI